LPIEGLSLLLIKAYGLDATQAHLWLTNPNLSSRLLLACIALAILPVPVAVFLEALACRLMGHVHEGVTSRWDLSYIRIWLKAELVESGSRWLYGTLFWPHWLRLAGMKVGTGCELSTLIGTLPETIEIGAKTFCADGIYLGAPQLHRGTVAVTKTSLGQNNFIGNGAIIAAGQTLPDNVLLGVCTVAADSPMRPDSAWFGHPPFELPRREILSFDSSLTHHPSRTRYAVRVFWELLRFALPLEAAFVVPLWFHWMALAEGSLSHKTFLLLGVPFLSVSAALIPPALAIVLKWCLLGKVRPGTHPLWSSWASRWDFHCLTWNLYAARIASTLEGTLLLNVLLRTMGAKIGRGVLLGPGAAEDLADPDMMTIDDNATVDCLFQAHTFEDRVLKMDYVRLRKHATIGRNTVLLYGADIGENTIIAPNSVVMKHEHLLANTDYAGFPLRPTRSN
jgi:non-ribosomal peptide synthetase-like protein